MSSSNRALLKYILVGVWLLFTVTLLGWWLVFSLTELARIRLLDATASAELERYQKMILWEGGTLVICIVGGGSALAYYIFREIRLRQQLQLFFLTFAHELRTPLASLRLQAESLEEDLDNPAHQKLIKRLVTDTNRLSIRLENSLLFANLEDPALHVETCHLNSLLSQIASEWPALTVKISGDASVRTDRRLLESIFKNLLQNSITHGKASEINCDICSGSSGIIQATILDNGTGIGANVEKLGKPFFRPYSGSGSGIGLYLVSALATFEPSESGFKVRLTFREA
jgi:signal transduction histidine kinase